LHTPTTSLRLLETGEAYKQHNRQLLRGYLSVLDDQPDDAGESASDLESRNNRLQLALQLNQRAQQEQLEHLERVRGQQDLILRLARQRYSAENSLLEAAQLITQSACEIYKVDSASIWHLDDQRLEPITAWYRDAQEHRQPEAI
ncbi:diguanylate cyclase, partial [Pseudomonas sp. SIMBA_059]